MGLFENIKQAHLDEPCPTCKAESGDRCRTPAGRTPSKPHANRIFNGNILYQQRLESGYYDKKD